jgi:dynein heavy chain 2
MWTGQQEARIEDTMRTCAPLLEDLPTFATIKTRAHDLTQEMVLFRREQYDGWCRDVIDAIENTSSPLALQTTGRLMELHASRGTLHVNYSDRLVRLLTEVRQLSSLGYSIPAKILACANTGEKFYRHAILLKQVSHFYNTIDQQMLPCHQAILLESAVAFEALIKTAPVRAGTTPTATAMQVTWDDPKQLHTFIQRLQAAAQRLTMQNRRLRTLHSQIEEKVYFLF